MIPTIVTERMILRAPIMADFPPYADILASDRAVHIGGPLDRHHAWLDFGALTGSWHLLGFGALTMEERKTERFLGLSILDQEDGDPEPELGWVLSKDAEGHGFAHEAATATRRHAYAELGWHTAVSYIAPKNTRSAKLAQKLGAKIDPKAEKPRDYPECEVYRHPSPAALGITQTARGAKP